VEADCQNYARFKFTVFWRSPDVAPLRGNRYASASLFAIEGHFMGSASVIDTVLSNGLRFVGERLDNRQGVALAVRIQAGAKDDPANKFGLASLVQETLLKGTQKKDARKLADAFDYYGIRHSEHTGTESTVLQLRFLPEHTQIAMDLLREVLSQPSFPEKECETNKSLALQELKRLDDEPGSKAWVNLKELYFGNTWGHPEIGHETSIPELSREDVVNFWKGHYIPAGTTVAAAGKFDHDVLQKHLETLFANSGPAWPQETPPAPPTGFTRKHLAKDSQQTQICMAFPGVAHSDADYYAARLAVGVLSGGMSGRLFTEVREKRALVYSVGAQTISLRKSGCVCAYAGTTTPRAKETLSVMKNEFARLGNDCTQEEVDRARVGLKAHLLMDQESTGSRARGLLDDVFYENRVVPLQEVIQRIDAVTLSEVKNYWTSHPHEPYTLVTLGKEELE
jgi:predicted Zn-dependent peptidase